MQCFAFNTLSYYALINKKRYMVYPFKTCTEKIFYVKIIINIETYNPQYKICWKKWANILEIKKRSKSSFLNQGTSYWIGKRADLSLSWYSIDSRSWFSVLIFLCNILMGKITCLLKYRRWLLKQIMLLLT